MTDQRIQYTEEMVGYGHPNKADTLNRFGNVEHDTDGTHQKAISHLTASRAVLTDGSKKLVSDEAATGTGAPVRANSCTLIGPNLGTPASGTLTNCTGYPETAITGYPIHEVSEFPDDHTAAGLALLDDETAAAQRTTLGLGTIATQDASNINISGGTISGITDIAIADGGTGASTAAAARTALGVAIGSDVMAFEAYSIHEIEELCGVD